MAYCHDDCTCIFLMIFHFVGNKYKPKKFNAWQGNFPKENSLEDGYLGKGGERQRCTARLQFSIFSYRILYPM